MRDIVREEITNFLFSALDIKDKTTYALLKNEQGQFIIQKIKFKGSTFADSTDENSLFAKKVGQFILTLEGVTNSDAAISISDQTVMGLIITSFILTPIAEQAITAAARVDDLSKKRKSASADSGSVPGLQETKNVAVNSSGQTINQVGNATNFMDAKTEREATDVAFLNGLIKVILPKISPKEEFTFHAETTNHPYESYRLRLGPIYIDLVREISRVLMHFNVAVTIPKENPRLCVIDCSTVKSLRAFDQQEVILALKKAKLAAEYCLEGYELDHLMNSPTIALVFYQQALRLGCQEVVKYINKQKKPAALTNNTSDAKQASFSQSRESEDYDAELANLNFLFGKVFPGKKFVYQKETANTRYDSFRLTLHFSEKYLNEEIVRVLSENFGVSGTAVGSELCMLNAKTVKLIAAEPQAVLSALEKAQKSSELLMQGITYESCDNRVDLALKCFQQAAALGNTRAASHVARLGAVHSISTGVASSINLAGTMPPVSKAVLPPGETSQEQHKLEP